MKAYRIENRNDSRLLLSIVELIEGVARNNRQDLQLAESDAAVA